MSRPRHVLISQVSKGHLEYLLAGTLAALAITLGMNYGGVSSIALDLALCALAAATVRWPRIAGIALGVLLLVYLVTPPRWAGLGEYAPLIPILGTGMRGKKRERTVMSIGYLLILTAIQYTDYPGRWLFLGGGVVWACLFGVLWLIGNTFTAYRTAVDEAHRATLERLRVALARDLHDTVARDLGRAALRAQAAQRSGDTSALSEVIDTIHRAGSELRLTMSLLREPGAQSLARAPSGSFGAQLEGAIETLQQQGYLASLAVDGDLETIPRQLAEALGAAVHEGVANVERHATPGGPCALVVSVEDGVVDLVLINEAAADSHGSGVAAMGLTGVRERLEPLGGRLEAEREGTSWVLRATAPIAA